MSQKDILKQREGSAVQGARGNQARSVGTTTREVESSEATQQCAACSSVLVYEQLNFVDPLSCRKQAVAWQARMKLHDLVPERIDVPCGLDVICSVNGHDVTDLEAELYRVKPNDAVLFRVVPRGGGNGGKNPLKMIAMLAVTIVSAIVAPYAAPYLAGSLMSLETATCVATGVFAMAGSLLVNAVLPPDKPTQADRTNITEDSPTYSWKAANPSKNGSPVAIVQGDCKNVLPFKLSQYISTDGDKQYINALYAVGEGELEISNVCIKDMPVDQYNDVVIEKTSGTATQAPLKGFQDGVYERPVSMKLSYGDWTYFDGEGDAIEAVGFGISCPSGLYYANDDGGFGTTQVQLAIERAPYGTTNWQRLATPAISAAQRTAVRRYWRFTLPKAKHLYRVKLAAQPPSDATRYVNDVWWEYVQEIVPDDFRHPYTACFALKGLATDQFSGSFDSYRITCNAKRMTAQLPDGNGGLAERSLTNPAWMALELATNPRFGAGLPEHRIVVDEFAAAAEWCDQLGIASNMYWDSQTDLASAWDELGRFGRFRVIPRGTRYGVISDRPVLLPDQSFIAADSNTLLGTTSIEYLPVKERAEAVEITWFHPEKGRQILRRHSPHYHKLKTRLPSTAKITLAACNDFESAWRYAGYRLNCNRFITRTIKRTMSVDAASVQPGHVIQAVVRDWDWGESARVHGGSATQITLTQPVTLAKNTPYSLQVKHGGMQNAKGQELVEMVDIEPVAEDTVTSALLLSQPLSAVPQVGSVATVGKTNDALRLFRVSSIRRTSKNRVEVTGVEYAEEVYADDGELPVVDGDAGHIGARNLTCSVQAVDEDGLHKKLVHLSWQGNAITWRIFTRKVGVILTPWQLYGTTRNTQITLRGIEDKNFYRIAVSHTDNPADGAVTDILYDPAVMGTGTIRPLRVIADNRAGFEPLMYETESGEALQLMEVF
ncbi:TipJ family phage tail tip protein [Halodesulfovibrio aestuarii]|uniref:Tip attachment protein J HDII-ins2 domain-containing protein n=1 Tax=Halodesulfovibrio aestuarii TaxID=126333 RepID=A0ABV4JZC0_9BACT